MIVSVLVLFAVLASAAGCLVGGGMPLAWALLISSSLWFPANNGHLEGPTLVQVTARHGLTVADLVGLAGAVLAIALIARQERRLRVLAGCAVILVAGMAAAVATGG